MTHIDGLVKYDLDNRQSATPLTDSQFANRIYCMIKGQDIVVLAKLMDKNAWELTYAELGEATRISASEAHSAIRRLQEASLVNSERHLMKRNVREFLFHALRYFFPLKYAGGVTKGMPTSYSAPVAHDMFSTSGLPPVWNGSDGTVLGLGVEPVYPTAPAAAESSPALYNALALIDMLRGGRIRERLFAEGKIEEMLS